MGSRSIIGAERNDSGVAGESTATCAVSISDRHKLAGRGLSLPELEVSVVESKRGLECRGWKAKQTIYDCLRFRIFAAVADCVGGWGAVQIELIVNEACTCSVTLSSAEVEEHLNARAWRCARNWTGWILLQRQNNLR